MAFVLVLTALLLQDPPTLRSVEPLTGPSARSGCWYPVVVRLHSAAEFDGELAASADWDYRVRRPLKLGAGSEVSVLIAAIPLQEDAKIRISVLRGREEVAFRELSSLQLLGDHARLVLVDRSHPRAAEWDGTSVPAVVGPVTLRPRVSDAAWWDEAARRGWLEAADAVIGGPEGLGIWETLGGSRIEDLRQEVPAPVRWKVIEPRSAALRGGGRWIGAKRDAAVLFTAVYGFALFTAVFLAWTRKLGPAALWGGVGGVTIAFVAAFYVFFPRGDGAIQAHRAVYRSGGRDAAVTVHEIRRSSAPPTEYRSSTTPKPVVASLPEVHLVRMEALVGPEQCTVTLATPPESNLLLTVDGGAWTSESPPASVPRAVQEFFTRGTAAWQAAGREASGAGPFTLGGAGIVELRFRTLIRYERIR